MIPKHIHYCWFGRGEKPKLVQKCIASWKAQLPDYTFTEWNEDNFDVEKNDFVRGVCTPQLRVRQRLCPRRSAVQ